MSVYTLINKKDIEAAEDVDRIIREEECKTLSGLANSSRWKQEKAGKFPPRRKIGQRAVGYRLSEVLAWIRGEWQPEGNQH